jgi:zinc protease
MHRRLYVALAAVLTLATALPPAVPRVLAAQELQDTVTVSYELDGLRVLHHRSRDATFSAGIYLLGGTQLMTPETQGIENLYLTASNYGTVDFPGDEARRALARTGSSIYVDAGYDWTEFGASGLTGDFDATWALLTSRLLRPTLDSAALNIARLRLLTRVRARMNSPGAQAYALAESLAYHDHPYALNPGGSEASLQALTADDLRAYATAQFVKTRMLVVVVGNISREALDAQLAKSFGALPRGSYQWTLPPPVTAAAAATASVNRRIPTNHMAAYIHGPQISSEEYPAFEYSMGILSNFVSSVIREREGLSYAAGVSVVPRGASGAVITVSTTRPDSVAKLLNLLLDSYESDLRFPNWVLKEAADNFKQQYLFGMESSASHADMLARAYLYNGDHLAAARRAEVMAAVRSPDFRRAVRNHAKNLQFGFVGDTSKVPDKEMAKRK